MHGTGDDVRRVVEDYHARARLGDRINLAAKGTFGELLDLWLEHARLADSTRAVRPVPVDDGDHPGPPRRGRRVRLDPLALALLADEWERQWEHAAACGTSLQPDGGVFAHPRSPDSAVTARPDAFSRRFGQLCERLGVTLYRGL